MNRPICVHIFGFVDEDLHLLVQHVQIYLHLVNLKQFIYLWCIKVWGCVASV